MRNGLCIVATAVALVAAVFSLAMAGEGEEAAPRPKEERVRALLELAGVAENSAGEIRDGVRSIPGVRPGVVAWIEETLDASELLDLLVPIYAKRLDGAAIDAWLAFNESPEGRRVAAAMPRILTQSRKAIDSWSAALLSRARAETVRKTPPVLPDAVRVWKEMRAAVEGLPVRLVKLDVQARGAVVRVEVERQAVFDAVRKQIEQSPYFQERARNSTRIVELRAQRVVEGLERRDFELRFAEGSGARAPSCSASSISLEFMAGALAETGVRISGTSSERTTPNKRGGYELITQAFDLASGDGQPKSLVLESLRMVLDRINESGIYRVTELCWERISPTDDVPEPGDAVKRSRIEVAAWRPLHR